MIIFIFFSLLTVYFYKFFIFVLGGSLDCRWIRMLQADAQDLRNVPKS